MRFSGFMALFLILVVAWLVAFLVYHVANGAIHLLLVFAVISLALHFLWDGKKNDLSRPRGE
jgi:RsiW-degrading membrane proteinase PrsW (M82 family)